MTRTGKIARLPQTLRDELNQRLQEGESGQDLVQWLNGLPEVRAVLEKHFPQHPEIREQNLSEWRKGGYEDWLQQERTMELAERLQERAEELQAREQQAEPAKRLSMEEVLTLWLVSRYTLATRQIEATEGEAGWKMLRHMCGDVVKLRRMKQQEQRVKFEGDCTELHREMVQLERERLAMDRERRMPAPTRQGGSSKQAKTQTDPAQSGLSAERPWEDYSD